jgi:hypothetical protein
MSDELGTDHKNQFVKYLSLLPVLLWLGAALTIYLSPKLGSIQGIGEIPTFQQIVQINRTPVRDQDSARAGGANVGRGTARPREDGLIPFTGVPFEADLTSFWGIPSDNVKEPWQKARKRLNMFGTENRELYKRWLLVDGVIAVLGAIAVASAMISAINRNFPGSKLSLLVIFPLLYGSFEALESWSITTLIDNAPQFHEVAGVILRISAPAKVAALAISLVALAFVLFFRSSKRFER